MHLLLRNQVFSWRFVVNTGPLASELKGDALFYFLSVRIDLDSKSCPAWREWYSTSQYSAPHQASAKESMDKILPADLSATVSEEQVE